MTQIKDAARIIRNGRVTTPKALVAAVVTTCAASTCTESVQKDGNFCSMTCALTPKEAPVSDHTAPCKDMLTTCIDLECQVRKGLRQHLLMNVTEKDRPKASEVALIRLDRMLNDSQYGNEAPEFFLAALVEGIDTFLSSPPSTHVQAPKAVLTSTTKAVRKPRTAKIQPRITDNKEHPVTEKITMTKAEMERAIKAAAERLVQERVQEILATKQVAPADKPVEIVKAKGGRAKVQRATAKDREYVGTTLPAIVVNDSLTIPALEVGEESVDTVASSTVRSPYNKARYRLDKTPTALDKETTTYRSLIAEHLRITALVGAAPKAKTTKVAAVIEPAKKAKVSKKKVKALMSVLGMTEAEALAHLGK